MADVTPLGDGRYLVADETTQSVAYAAGPANARWVFLNGRVYLIDTTRGDARRPAQEDDAVALASPMPAKVAAVKVEAGQQVTRGDLLIMLEAMKMELPLRAPRDGRVKSVACRPGDLVQPGVPLLELEPELDPEPEPSSKNPEP